MSALKLSVDSLDGIDDAIKGLYVEKDGKFALQVEGIEDTSGLKSALQKERVQREAAEKQRKSWDKLGKTPDEIQEMLDAQAKADEARALEAGNFDSVKRQMNEKHAAEIAAIRASEDALRQKYKSRILDAEAVSAIAAAKGVPDLLMPIVQRFTKVDDNDNAVVVDAKGDPRVNGKGEPLTISDLVLELRASEIYGRAFDASGHSGSGTPPSSGKTGGPGGRVTKAEMIGKDKASTEKRNEYIRQHGWDAYAALK